MVVHLEEWQEEPLLTHLAGRLNVRHRADDTMVERARYYRDLALELGKRNRLTVGWLRQGSPGRPSKWSEDRLLKLFADATVVSNEHPDWDDIQICGELVRADGPYRKRWARTANKKQRDAKGLRNKLRQAQSLPNSRAVLNGDMNAEDRGRFLAIYALRLPDPHAI